MKNWEKHFGIVGCTKFVMPGIGEIDSTQEVSEDKLLKAYERGCTFVVLTPEGYKKYFPDKEPITVHQIEHFEPVEKHKYKKTEKPC